MTRKRRIVLSLEQLEDRLVPATAHFVSGTLLISPSPGESGLNLTVTQSSANTFQVTDNGKPVGTYGPVANLDITGGSGADSITVDLDGKTYTGNLLINSGTGNDTLTIQSTGGAGGIGGNTTLITGTGVDSINLNSAGTTAIRFGGSVQVISTGNQSTLNFGSGSSSTAATTVGRGLSITNVPNVNITNQTLSSADVINGGLTINDPNLGNFDTINVGNPGTGFGSSSIPLTINGNVNVSVGSSSATVDVGFVTVNNSTNLNLGNGSDTVTLGQFTGAHLPTSFNGSVTINHTSGVVEVFVDQGVVVTGNMNVQLGNATGSDTNTFTSQSTGFVLYGNLSVTGGNGDNQITANATVFGNITITLGNSLAPNGNSTLFLIPPTGTVTYTDGNGPDSVFFVDPSASSIYNVNMHFGTGSDTLTLVGPGAITGSVVSQAPGNNVFNNFGFTIIQPFYFDF